MIAVVAATLSVQSAYAQTQTIATPLNANAINLLNPFSTLLGTTAITQNFSTAVSINNNSSAAQRAQALIDNTITTDNGVVLSDGLGTNLNAIWKANNSQAANGTTTTFSTNLQMLFRQINAISQDNSGEGEELLRRRLCERLGVRQQRQPGARKDRDFEHADRWHSVASRRRL